MHLRELIQATIEAETDVDIPHMTDVVFEAIDPADYADVLRQALPIVVAKIVTQYRPHSTPTDFGTGDQARGDTQNHDVAGTDSSNGARSWKVQAWQEENWMRRLRQPVKFNDCPGARKRFAELTWDEVAYMAGRRESMAVQNAEEAETLRLIEKHGRESAKTTVGELDESFLRKVLA